MEETTLQVDHLYCSITDTAGQARLVKDKTSIKVKNKIEIKINHKR